VRDVARQGPTRRRRLDELDVQVAEAHERPQVGPEAREGPDDRFEGGPAVTVGPRPEGDQGPRRDVDGLGPCRPVVEAS